MISRILWWAKRVLMVVLVLVSLTAAGGYLAFDQLPTETKQKITQLQAWWDSTGLYDEELIPWWNWTKANILWIQTVAGLLFTFGVAKVVHKRSTRRALLQTAKLEDGNAEDIQ